MELLVIATILTLAGSQQSKLEGPQNTLNVVGSTVTLKCSSPTRNCIGIDWQKYVPGASPITIFKGPRTILNINITDRDRYSVDNSSGCDLVIRNVQLKDAGRFICSAIMNSSQATKTAHLIILRNQPECETNPDDDTEEGDLIELICAVTYSGTNLNASMTWKGVEDAPDVFQYGKTIIYYYKFVASAPEVPSFTCEISFLYETHAVGTPISGLATNRVPNVTCQKNATRILYSVRNVSLSPSLSNYAPGSVVTCTANGHPSPTFKWEELENNGTWKDIPIRQSSELSLGYVGSKRYRCVALNVVKGRSYNATSDEIQFNTEEPTSSRTMASEGFGIGFGVGLLVAILLATVAFAILFRLKYLEFHSRPDNKSPDGGAQHKDHKMSPSSHQLSAIHSSASRPKASIPGELESTYASLGEDRDDNEYASLEQRQKAKPKTKSKP